MSISYPTTPQNQRRFDVVALVILVLSTVGRFWWAGQHDLVQDESYYWQWSRHLAVGYYDNTPVLAWVIRAGVGAFGATEVGVRSGAIVSALVVSVFIYLLGRRYFSPVTALVALSLAVILPLFAAGSVLMTQDPVQLAFWSATLYVVACALEGNGGLWYVAGLLAGLTAMSKLNGLLLLPSVFLYLIVSPIARTRWLKRPEPYVAGLIAMIVFAPFVWWNTTHQNAFWIHIGAMGSRSHPHDGLKWFFRFLGDQAVELSPLFFILLLVTLATPRERTDRARHDGWLFLWCPTAVVFVATALLSLRSKVEGNWPVAAYVTGVILIADLIVTWWQRSDGQRDLVGSRFRARRLYLVIAAVLAVTIDVAVLFPQTFYAMGLKVPDPKNDRTDEVYGWRTLAKRVEYERQQMPKNAFVFGVNYRIPSELAFYLPDQPNTYSLFLRDRANEYMFWENPRRLLGRDAVYVHDSDVADHLDDLRAVFSRISVQPELKIYRELPYGNHAIRTLQIVRCYGFKGYDVKYWQDGW